MTKRIHIIAGLVITALGAVPFQFASAQSDALKSALQGVTESALQITDSPAASSTTDDVDIATRQTALMKVFDLSLVEMKELKDKLSAMKGDINPELLAMRDRLIDDLKLYIPQVEERKKAAGADGITLEAVQESAADFKQWREDIYDPETKLIVDLLFVLQGKQVLKTADARYEKISADIKQLQTVLGSGALTLKPYQTQALKELRAARSLETQAQDLLISAFEEIIRASSSPLAIETLLGDTASGTPATSTIATTAPATSSGATTTSSSTPNKKEIPKPSVQELMKQAYGHVSQVYKLFLKMSKLASDLLSQ